MVMYSVSIICRSSYWTDWRKERCSDVSADCNIWESCWLLHLSEGSLSATSLVSLVETEERSGLFPLFTHSCYCLIGEFIDSSSYYFCKVDSPRVVLVSTYAVLNCKRSSVDWTTTNRRAELVMEGEIIPGP